MAEAWSREKEKTEGNALVFQVPEGVGSSHSGAVLLVFAKKKCEDRKATNHRRIINVRTSNALKSLESLVADGLGYGENDVHGLDRFFLL